MSTNRNLTRRFAAGLLLSVPVQTLAAPTIAPPLTSHAVVQRDVPIEVRGTAAAGDLLRVALGPNVLNVRADAQGRWTARLPAMAAGGPYRLEASAKDGVAVADDVMVGDVWLCSGQSNMEYPMRRTLNGEGELQSVNDPQIRIMKVARQTSVDPRASFEEAPAWAVATPDSAKEFSAACYLMVRDLAKSQPVAFGAIDDTWGGTPIRAWTDEQGVRASGGASAADLVQLYRRDRFGAARRFGEEWGGWWRGASGDLAGQEPWRASDLLAWRPVPSFTYWEAWGPEFKTFDGAAWARRRIELTPAEAAGKATLSIGVVDDLDLTFVNGVAVGSTNDWDAERNYAIPPGVLKAGTNEILVYVRDNWGPGGFAGPADKLALKFADGHSKPIGEGWEYSLVPAKISAPPLAPWEGMAGIGTIYNAMIAPLGRLGLKGVAWYQGEADVGSPAYDQRLAAMMASWRRQFGSPGLSFLIVGLAGWGKPVDKPGDSAWAALIDEQRKAVTADPVTALVSAIDLGDWLDIHPANKQEVGRRLALAANALVYKQPAGALSPMPIEVTRTATGVTVRLSKPVRTLSGAGALGFELCGPVAGSCRFRAASVNGNLVEIAGDGLPASRVRYAWADYPVVNLYDAELLPVPVFELPVR